VDWTVGQLSPVKPDLQAETPASSSPYLFGVILSIICATICLLYHPLFPYPYYALGMTFFRPYICQIAINLACAVLIFPESLHDQFLNRLKGVLVSLQGILADQENLLSTDPTTSEWSTYKRHKVQLAGASKALGMLGMSESLLQRNVTVQRASAKDLQELLVCQPVSSGCAIATDIVYRLVLGL
jgi:hypothetical protein